MKGMTEVYLAMVFLMPPAGSRMTAVPVSRSPGGWKH